ncbi:MAG: hypothetical protein J6A03_10050 [Lachnospiraceae bacterium]|nr:hypothetical protein [Lachnospiraceae bacterium]
MIFNKATIKDIGVLTDLRIAYLQEHLGAISGKDLELMQVTLPSLFDKVVDLTYENEQLRSKIQGLQDKLEKAYEFMKQFVINGRNMLDVFRERIGEVKEWVHRKVAGMGR